MSKWEEVEHKSDIDIFENKLTFHLESDQEGSRYVQVNIKDVIEILKEGGFI